MENQSKMNVLVVDDKYENLKLLSCILKEDQYKVRPVTSGKMAIQTALFEKPDIILMDIMMPEMDGIQVCRLLKENVELRDIPVIFLSALNDVDNIVKSFEAGGVDYITKPFYAEEVKARLGTHIKIINLQNELTKHNFHLRELVQEQVKEISEAQLAIIFALAKLAEYRDDDTGKHLIRVRKFSKFLAMKMKENTKFSKEIDDEFISNIYTVSPLHDIGKVGIPDNVLLKPGKLTTEEFEIMKKHTKLGADAIKEVAEQYKNNNLLKMGYAIAKYHHEKWNGKGYPEGVAGENIPLCARIAAVADVYDALRTRRVYKEAFTHEVSREIIVNGRGEHFDPDVVQAFIDVEEKFIEIANKYSE